MSLFPAYAAGENSIKNAESVSEWLENESFAASTTQLQIATKIEKTKEGSSSSSTSSSSESEIEKQAEYHKKKKRKKHKKEKFIEAPALEFDGSEDYYVDKKASLNYKTIKTLHKPACPRYNRYSRRWLQNEGADYVSSESLKFKALKRYYREIKTNKFEDSMAAMHALDENEYTLRLGQLNRKVLETPNEIQNWMDLIYLQERNPYKWSRLLLAEKKIDIVKRAMVYHQRNETLYRIFIDTISDTYPSFEVSKLLDGLLSKDSYSYVLWTAQIMTTQGSMARCIVPDVLRIYERCMQKMHHAVQSAAVTDTDVIMLRLFNNCALFLRQAGLYEQFFALIKLALELNVSTNHFSNLEPSEDDQKTLIEYEELILQSGLPMNEIWLRIEKLRQCFNFLPCPANSKCSDPQRIVFNEDVCSYIYPLKRADNSFYLMLLILRLLKLPFVQCDGLATKFSARVDAIGDSDAVEEILAIGLRLSQEQEHFEYFCSLFELSKEMAVTPTFLSSNIGYEIYVKCIRDLLIKGAASYAGIDERRRIIFLQLLCRFERLLLMLEKAAKKLTPEFIKQARSRFKTLLKEPANRASLPLYTELALFEYAALQAGDSLESVQKTFENIIESMHEESASTYLSYAEILVDRHDSEAAFQVLAAYVLKVDIKQKCSIGNARRLAALKQVSEKVDQLLTVERNVEIMVLEQYLQADQTVVILKIRCLLQYLAGQQLETLSLLDKLINIFRSNNERHQFLRERIYEIYLYIARLPVSNCLVSNAALSQKLFEALKLYPRNLYFLQTCGTLMLPWYRIRSAMLGEEPNVLSVTFLIAAARFRFLNVFKETSSLTILMPCTGVIESDFKHAESIVRNRILNIFRNLIEPNSSNSHNEKIAVGHKILRRNALFWRLYLRCLSDQNTAFETSKKCLLTALDDCPWNKSLYLDGATYVPQELSHLQDLMIEKQLRVYALPEELEILRER